MFQDIAQNAQSATDNACQHDEYAGTSSSEINLSTEDFLTRIVPQGGSYVIGLKRPAGIGHKFFTDAAEAAAFARQAAGQGHTVYHACASFGPKDGGRKATNALAAQALWLDIDCGDGKPYLTKRAGGEALASYVTAARMPKPLVVDSGRGLHVYWPLDRALPRDEWLVLAQALKDSAHTHGLQADRSRTADIASVLRPVGTVNLKDGGRRPVRAVMLNDGPANVEALRALLGGGAASSAAYAPGCNSALSAGLSSGTSAPPKADDVAAGCAQLANMRDTLGVMDYPNWYACLGVLAYCEDGDEKAHEWSAGDHRYDPAQVNRFLDDWRKLDGGSTCAKFWSIDPAGCAACPSKDRIRSPLAIGRRHADDTPPPDPWLQSSPDAEPAEALSSSTALTPYDFRQFDVAQGWNNIPPRPWVIGRFALRGEVTMLSAPGGTGKSAYLLGLAVATASKNNFLLHSIPDRLKVAVVNAEDSRDELMRRVHGATQYHNISPSYLAGWLYLIGAGDIGDLTLNQINSGTRHGEVSQAGIAKLERLINDLKIDVLILDPFVALCPAGLNDNAVAAATMAAVKQMAQRTNCAIIIAHHVRKGTGRGGIVSADDASGAAAIINLCRNAFSLSNPSDDDAKSLGLLPSEAWRCIELTNTKANLAPLADRDRYELVSVQIPSGDNVQVVEQFRPRGVSGLVPPAAWPDILKAIAAGENGDPLSAKARSSKYKFAPPIAKALRAHLPKETIANLERFAAEVRDEAVSKGWVIEQDVKASGTRTRPGLFVVWGATPWASDPAPEGPNVR